MEVRGDEISVKKTCPSTTHRVTTLLSAVPLEEVAPCLEARDCTTGPKSVNNIFEISLPCLGLGAICGDTASGPKVIQSGPTYRNGKGFRAINSRVWETSSPARRQADNPLIFPVRHLHLIGKSLSICIVPQGLKIYGVIG